MLDGFPFDHLDVTSGWALVGLFVILIATGRLVPRRTYDDKVHEANEWRAEGRIKDQQIAEKDEQLRMVRELGDVVHMIMRAIQTRAAAGDHEEPSP